MKRIFAIILTAAALFSLCAAAYAAGGDGSDPDALNPYTFSDIPKDAPYRDAVVWCYAHGLMKGVGGDRFDPAGTLTRETLVTVLHRAEGQPTVVAGTHFTDDVLGHWYTDAVVWADSTGIITGYGGNIFGVGDPVTKVQMDVIFQRYQGKNPAWPGDPTKAPATRAEVAVALMTYLKDKLEAPSAGTTETPDTAPASASNKTLVAVFSATGNTKGVAEKIAAAANADLYEITSAQPYTSADLNYNTDCRANDEQNDDSARPEITGSVENWADYDTVFLGYSNFSIVNY